MRTLTLLLALLLSIPAVWADDYHSGGGPPLPVSVLNGGTGATNISDARNNLLVPTTTDVVLRDGTQSMLGSLDMGGNTIITLGTPGTGDQATNKEYVDGFASGLYATNHVTKIRRKSAHEFTSSDTSLDYDSELKIPIPFNRDYTFEVVIFYASANAGLDDLKYSMRFDGTGPLTWASLQESSVGVLEFTSTEVSDGEFVAGTAATDKQLRIVGSGYSSGSESDLSFRWAQNTSQAGTLVIREGSYMKVTMRVP
jgi:hypothetical protein